MLFEIELFLRRKLNSHIGQPLRTSLKAFIMQIRSYYKTQIRLISRYSRGLITAYICRHTFLCTVYGRNRDGQPSTGCKIISFTGIDVVLFVLTLYVCTRQMGRQFNCQWQRCHVSCHILRRFLFYEFTCHWVN